MATPNQSRLIAQSIGISEYALNLSTLAPRQIVYNGKYTYMRHGVHHPSHGGWCHLLLLRGELQWLAIITQVPDCGISVVNEIEHIASSVLSFFNIPFLLSRSDQEDEENEWEDIHLTPKIYTLPPRILGLFSIYLLDALAWKVLISATNTP